MVRSRRRERPTLRPHPGPVPMQEPAAVLGGKSGALRAAIFGVNDGLVSNLSLIMGVAGAGVGNDVILLAGIAGLLAGAFSMAAGEYVSMRTQRELFERMIHLEAHELGVDPQGETEELAAIFRRKGIPAELARQTAEALMADPETALAVHAREELGLDPDELGSPQGAAASSFATFATGALVPLVPFLVTAGLPAGLVSVGLSLAALFGVGASMTVFTGKWWVRSGARMLAIGAGAALVTYTIGVLLGVTALS